MRAIGGLGGPLGDKLGVSERARKRKERALSTRWLRVIGDSVTWNLFYNVLQWYWTRPHEAMPQLLARGKAKFGPPPWCAACASRTARARLFEWTLLIDPCPCAMCACTVCCRYVASDGDAIHPRYVTFESFNDKGHDRGPSSIDTVFVERFVRQLSTELMLFSYRCFACHPC